MNKGFTNAMKAVKEQAFFDGFQSGLDVMCMIALISFHNVAGDDLSNEQYKEICDEAQRVMDEFEAMEKTEGRLEAREHLGGITNQVRKMHDLDFIRW